MVSQDTLCQPASNYIEFGGRDEQEVFTLI